MNLVVHGMEGFGYEKAAALIDLPKDHTIEAMIAVGKPGKKEDLPKEAAEKEMPSDRKPLSETIFSGSFPKES